MRRVCVIMSCLYVVAFVVTMIVLFCIYGAVPDTLIQFGLIPPITELAACYGLKKNDMKKKADDDEFIDACIDDDSDDTEVYG